MAPQSAFQLLHTSFSAALHSGYPRDADCSALRSTFAASQLADSERRTVVEHCFREHLFEHIIGHAATAATSGSAADLSRIGRFCDYAIAAGRQQLATAALPVILVADVFDVLTLDQCELVFAYVEDNVGVWREDWMFAASKNILLRMCNDLLRRLSRSQNTVFCGRILLFLAKFFPFSERSGLNVVSEFNLENLTEFEREAAAVAVDGGMEMEAGVGAVAKEAVRLDHSLYCKFWAMQDFFRSPNQCYQRAQWDAFEAHATSVLAAFASFKLDEPRPADAADAQQPLDAASAAAAAAMDVDLDDGLEAAVRGAQHFFAKFLTNPKLLALQLSDANFRRSVLVQFLILFQYLRSTVKFKADTFTLSAAQSEYIAATDTTIYRLLGETPPNGPQFAATVRHMLEREEMWNSWKNDGCREFSRPAAAAAAAAPAAAAAAAPATEEAAAAPAAAPATAATKAATKRRAAAAAADDRPLGDLVQDSLNAKRFYMGCPELTRLWNICPDNLQACRGEDRNFLPSIETYLENPKDKTDPSFEWRALRLLARQSPHFFSLTQTPNKVSDYLEGVRKKIHESKSKATAVTAGEKQTVVVVATTAAAATAAAAAAVKAELLTPPTAAAAAAEMAVDVETVSAADGADSQDGGSQQQQQQQQHEDDHNAHRIAVVSDEQMGQVAAIIGAAWRKVGAKMGYTPDVLKFIDDKPGKTVPEKCWDMLRIWFDEDEDASLDNLAYMLEGLELVVAAEAIKRIAEPADRMEDISE